MWQEERKEGEGTNLVVGALLGSVALSIPFYWKNVARLGACARPPPPEAAASSEPVACCRSAGMKFTGQGDGYDKIN